MIQTRFKKKIKILDVVITAVAGMLAVGDMLYGIFTYSLDEIWLEPILDVFYIACLVMMWMYFFNKLKTNQFNYWCTLCVGITVVLRDIIIPPELSNEILNKICLTLSVWLLLMLTYFYSRKEWKTYSKNNLWMIFIVDMILAALYHYDIEYYEVASNRVKEYVLTEIWIRPTITYGLVASFLSETEEKK